jgi:serine protease inhibitor ecotin
MSLRRIFLPSLMAASASMALAHAVAQTPPSPNAAPLPNGDQLLQRAIANQAKLAAEQERYECRVSDKITELDSK